MESEESVVCRKLAERDVDATAEVLARAFADNPAYAWMHPRARTRALDLRAFFHRNLRWHLALDLTWVATRGAGIVGTATLEPPGGVRRSTREEIRHWLIPTVRHQGLRTFVRTAAAASEFARHYRGLARGERYYHLHAVAVAPEAQGQGVGSLLVATALRELDRLSARDPAPAVVSTQLARNLVLYERAGFILRGEHQMGNRWGSRGYRTWFMTRDGGARLESSSTI